MIVFIPETHEYFYDRVQLEPVSTFIAKFKEKFDGEYWSLYKAIERYVILKKGEFYFMSIKRKVGHDKIIDYFTPKIQDWSFLMSLQEMIKKEWKTKNEIGVDYGNAYHEAQEDRVLREKAILRNDNEEHYHSIVRNTAEFNGLKNLYELPDGTYPELRIWNLKYLKCGTSDKVHIFTKNGTRYVDIEDYKTNLKIEEESFKKKDGTYKMMAEPINNLMDCKLVHYQLQLSCYAYFLEQFGYTINRLVIEKVRSQKRKKVEYLREEVEKMLKYDSVHNKR